MLIALPTNAPILHVEQSGELQPLLHFAHSITTFESLLWSPLCCSACSSLYGRWLPCPLSFGSFPLRNVFLYFPLASKSTAANGNCSQSERASRRRAKERCCTRFMTRERAGRSSRFPRMCFIQKSSLALCDRSRLSKAST